MTVTIRFPFPDSRLSANGRTDRRYLTDIRQAARQTGYYLAKEHKLAFGGEKPLEFYMLICPPDKRRRDDDNILSAFKSTRDGIFHALELDDSLIMRTVIERGDVERGGAVYVRLTEIFNERKGYG
jgi:crossover junction endodeoxyribonuclease RusA